MSRVFRPYQTFAEGNVKSISWEAGLGAIHGGLGVSVNYQVGESNELYAGIGNGYVLGVKHYLSDNVRLTANYGTNAYVDSKDFQGYNLGIGYVSNRNSAGFTVDLVYMDASSAENYCDRTPSVTWDRSSDVFVSFGYRW